jgi:hypothetical protein
MKEEIKNNIINKIMYIIGRVYLYSRGNDYINIFLNKNHFISINNKNFNSIVIVPEDFEILLVNIFIGNNLPKTKRNEVIFKSNYSTFNEHLFKQFTLLQLQYILIDLISKENNPSLLKNRINQIWEKYPQ